MPAHPETIEFARFTGDVPGDVLTRALAVGAVAPSNASYESPEITGDFSLEAYDPTTLQSLGAITTQTVLRSAVSSIGDHLPTIKAQELELGQLKESDLLGDLMESARMSALTGCVMYPEAYRDHKGYSRKTVLAAKELGIRGNSGVHRLVHFLRTAELTGQAPTEEELGKQIDHRCRNTACCSYSHTRPLNNAENNSLKDKARKVEPMIIGGQLFIVRDLLDELPWLQDTIVDENREIPLKVISTTLGPFALRAAHPEQAVVYGEKLKCEVFESLNPLGKSFYKRPTRAKKPKPIQGQAGIFPSTKYTKKTIPSAKDLYVAARAAA